MVGFDDIPAFFCPSTFGVPRAMRRVSMSKARNVRLEGAVRFPSFGQGRRALAAFLPCCVACRASFGVLKRPGCLIGVRVIFLFRSKRRFFAKSVFRAGVFGAFFREIARICHEKGAEKLWRKNKDCATARKTPRREAGRGRVEDDEAFSSTPNEHRAEALNCSGRRSDEHTR